MAILHGTSITICSSGTFGSGLIGQGFEMRKIRLSITKDEDPHQKISSCTKET